MEKIFIFCLVIIVTLSLSSCKFDGDSFDSIVSGDFIYSKVGVKGDNNIAIIGLSDEGKTKETLVFPATIDGYKVIQLGSNLGFKNSGTIVIDKAKTVYFGGNLKTVETNILYEFEDNIEQLNIFWAFNEKITREFYSSARFINNHKVYIRKTFYDEIFDRIDTFDNNYVPANIEYYLNENELYFLDDADGTKVNIIPPAPFREGYEFLGWYKDLHFINVWDFENDIIPKKEFDKDKNYIFFETKIFAKWKEIK